MSSLYNKITESELEIMRALWEIGGSATYAEIRATLLETTTWEESTIKTLLRRLVKKEVVSQEKKEVYYYSARITKKEYEEESTKSFLHKFFKGSVKNLVASLVEDQSLSKDDIKELREILDVRDHDE